MNPVAQKIQNYFDKPGFVIKAIAEQLLQEALAEIQRLEGELQTLNRMINEGDCDHENRRTMG